MRSLAKCAISRELREYCPQSIVQRQFDKNELNAFAYDMTGTTLAHPVNSKLAGRNLLEVPGPAAPMVLLYHRLEHRLTGTVIP